MTACGWRMTPCGVVGDNCTKCSATAPYSTPKYIMAYITGPTPNCGCQTDGGASIEWKDIKVAGNYLLTQTGGDPCMWTTPAGGVGYGEYDWWNSGSCPGAPDLDGVTTKFHVILTRFDDGGNDKWKLRITTAASNAQQIFEATSDSGYDYCSHQSIYFQNDLSCSFTVGPPFEGNFATNGWAVIAPGVASGRVLGTGLCNGHDSIATQTDLSAYDGSVIVWSDQCWLVSQLTWTDARVLGFVDVDTGDITDDYANCTGCCDVDGCDVCDVIPGTMDVTLSGITLCPETVSEKGFWGMSENIHHRVTCEWTDNPSVGPNGGPWTLTQLGVSCAWGTSVASTGTFTVLKEWYTPSGGWTIESFEYDVVNLWLLVYYTAVLDKFMVMAHYEAYDNNRIAGAHIFRGSYVNNNCADGSCSNAVNAGWPGRCWGDILIRLPWSVSATGGNATIDVP